MEAKRPRRKAREKTVNERENIEWAWFILWLLIINGRNSGTCKVIDKAMSYFAINNNNKKEVSLMEWKEEIARMVRKLLLDAVRKVPSRFDGFRCVRARWWGPSWGRHWGCWNCWCPQNRSAASLQRGSNCGGLYTRCPLGWAVQRMESSPKVPYRTCRRTKMPLGPK